jgi:putative phosphoesterase
MSSLAVISDIHGNIHALEAVWHDIQQRNVDEVICLGDLVGYYCFHNEVVAFVQENGIPCVLGNHDEAFLNRQGVIERSKTCTRILGWQLEHFRSDLLPYLQSIPHRITRRWAGKSMLCIHGGLQDPIDEYLTEVSEAYLKDNRFEDDVLITGHTHLPGYRKYFNGKMWINPGSVGQPRDGDNRASYALIHEDWNVEFIRVPYNYVEVAKAMELHGFDAYISAPLFSGFKIGA